MLFYHLEVSFSIPAMLLTYTFKQTTFNEIPVKTWSVPYSPFFSQSIAYLPFDA